jgi:hypothetical protein
MDAMYEPDEQDLLRIEEYDLVNEPVERLLNHIADIWNWPDWGFKFDGENLELHTGGWSGNEQIIRALKLNSLFFPLFWQMHERGGHYYFKINRKHLK